jgi:plasmid stability protein
MPALHLDDVPTDLYARVQELAEAHQHSVTSEVVRLLRRGLRAEVGGRSQVDLLAEMRQRSFLPPPGTPDSVELLREGRAR